MGSHHDCRSYAHGAETRERRYDRRGASGPWEAARSFCIGGGAYHLDRPPDDPGQDPHPVPSQRWYPRRSRRVEAPSSDPVHIVPLKGRHHHLGRRALRQSLLKGKRQVPVQVEPVEYTELLGKHHGGVRLRDGQPQKSDRVLFELFEKRFIAPYRGRYPKASDLLVAKDRDLRAAGLSRQKIAALRAVAEAFDSRDLDNRKLRRMDDDAVVEAVTQVRGIGTWTAHMLLIFSLGRPDVLPVGDYGVRKAAQRVYGLAGLPVPAELEELARRWRPYSSVASWYLWRALELPHTRCGHWHGDRNSER